MGCWIRSRFIGLVDLWHEVAAVLFVLYVGCWPLLVIVGGYFLVRQYRKSLCRFSDVPSVWFVRWVLVEGLLLLSVLVFPPHSVPQSGLLHCFFCRPGVGVSAHGVQISELRAVVVHSSEGLFDCRVQVSLLLY